MDSVLAHFASQPTFSIVQVGAYIGDSSNDPIFGFLDTQLAHHPGSTAVLIEPISDYFEQLQKASAHLPVICVNAAIAEDGGERQMYRLPSDVDLASAGLSDWVHQLSSLREDRMTTLWDGYEKMEVVQDFYLRHRVVETVRCTTLHELLVEN